MNYSEEVELFWGNSVHVLTDFRDCSTVLSRLKQIQLLDSLAVEFRNTLETASEEDFLDYRLDLAYEMLDKVDQVVEESTQRILGT